MITLRHRSVTEDAALWEYDPARRVLELSVPNGAGAMVSLTLRVCAPDKPIAFAHPLMRLDGEAWQVLPGIFVPEEGPSVPPDTAPTTLRQPRPVRMHPVDCAKRPTRPGIVTIVNPPPEGWIPCALHRAIGPSTHLVLVGAPPEVDVELEELPL